MRRFLWLVVSVVLLSGVARAAVLHIDVEKYSDPSNFGVTYMVIVYKNWSSTSGYRPFLSFSASRTPSIPLRGDSFRRTIWVDDGLEIYVSLASENWDAEYSLYIRDLNENDLAQFGPGRNVNGLYTVPAGLPSKTPLAYIDWPTGVSVALGDIYVDGVYWALVGDADTYGIDCSPLPLIVAPGVFLEIEGGRASEVYLYDKDMVLVDSSFVTSPSDPDNYLSYLVPGNPGPDPDPTPRSGGFCGGTPLLLFVWLLAYGRRRGR